MRTQGFHYRPMSVCVIEFQLGSRTHSGASGKLLEQSVRRPLYLVLLSLASHSNRCDREENV